jgi:hypothetical protein
MEATRATVESCEEFISFAPGCLLELAQIYPCGAKLIDDTVATVGDIEIAVGRVGGGAGGAAEVFEVAGVIGRDTGTEDIQ